MGYRPTLSANASRTAQFVCYMYHKGFKHSSISSTLSAIAYRYKIAGKKDPASHFTVQKLLLGAKKIQPSLDARIPVTLDILLQLIRAVNSILTSEYFRLFYRALYTVAQRAFLRIGEVLPSCEKDSKKVLQLEDVLCTKNNVTLSLKRFKTSAKMGTQSIHLAKRRKCCPVTYMSRYLKLRGNAPGPLFGYPGGTVYLRGEFDKILKQVVKTAGYNPEQIKGHSFRIGGATQAALEGKSDAWIRNMGRWSSDAYKKYIRT